MYVWYEGDGTWGPMNVCILSPSAYIVLLLHLRFENIDDGMEMISLVYVGKKKNS